MPDTPASTAAAPAGLTRDYLLCGDFAARLAASNPEMRVLSDAERNATLTATLAARPELGSGLWVFAYGSLIWNPLIHYTERRCAHVPGWRRSFCLSATGGRGTREQPGLMLGLTADRPDGAGCTGVAFRIAEAELAVELDVLWRREMVATGYLPRWVPIEDEHGAPFGTAIAFTINPAGRNYAGDLPEEEVVQRLATARGRLGTAAEYLFRTHDGLAQMGITDPLLARLTNLVENRMKFVA